MNILRKRKYTKRIFIVFFTAFVLFWKTLAIGETASPEGEQIAASSEKVDDEAVRKKAEKIAWYLQRAEKRLDENWFSRARWYAKKALLVDENNKETQGLLVKIDEAEKAYNDEKEALALKEKEDREKAKELKKEEERTGKINRYLSRAEAYLAKNKFTSARRYAKSALKVEEDNQAAQDMLERIDQAEGVYQEEKGTQKAVKTQEEPTEVQKSADKAVKDKARDDAKWSRLEKKIDRYIERSRQYLTEKDYHNAERFAYLAKKLDPTNSKVAVLITEITKEEMFGAREEREEAREERIEETLEEAPEGDPFDDFNEKKSWFEYVTDSFKKKTYNLGYVPEESTYIIDDCVRIALERSQRKIVSDRQVKLAEMRVWEARRDLLPEVTVRLEQTFGKIGQATGTRHYQGEKHKVEMKQTLFDGMESWADVEQAQANLEIVKLEREKIKNEIVAETKTAYYNLDKALKALDIQKRLKDDVNSLYDIIEKSYQQELVSRVEYLKVKGQNLQADFQYISAGEDISLAEMILFQAMNMEPDQPLKIKPVKRVGEPVPVGLENCYRLAEANRPDFKAKEKTIEYYYFDRKMMRARGWPKITFHGSFGESVENFQPTTTPGASRDFEPEWFAGVKGTFPAWGNTVEYNYVTEKWAPGYSDFQGYLGFGSETHTSYLNVKVLDDLAYFSNLQESRAGFENAKYEYLKAKKDLAVEVKETYFKYRKAILQVDVAKAKVEHQKSYVAVLQERLRYGEGETSKLIEEREKLAGDEYSIIQGDASYFIALTELNKAIGVPDYFRPAFEDEEYNQWKEGVDQKKEAEQLLAEVKKPKK